MASLPSLSNRESTLLRAFLRFMRANNFARLDASNLYTSTTDFGVVPAFLSVTFKSLCEKDVLVGYSDNNAFYYEIGQYYADELWELSESLNAENRIDINTPQTDDNQENNSIPASDRFVSVNHNSVEFKQVKLSLQELETRVLESNELVANKDERLAIIREVKGIGELLDQPLVRVASIWSATRKSGILWWLGQHIADATLRVLANDAISKILSLLKWK